MQCQPPDSARMLIFLQRTQRDTAVHVHLLLGEGGAPAALLLAHIRRIKLLALIRSNCVGSHADAGARTR
jgi:hypothetical protein